MNTATPMYEWHTLPWQKLERGVFKLQKRIYQAARRGDAKAVHRLQRLLMKSWSAKCLAVRRVTQDNRGKKTAGVDGIKALSPTARLKLVQSLKLEPKAAPTRRVWIPKPGKSQKRPLGIPTMHERAKQALVKLALEPEWEAKFEPNSYGFRPARSAHDAIAAIFNAIRSRPKYVLDADIAECFERINHQALLNKLATFPILRRIIKAWLRAGVMDRLSLLATTAGVPQGGVISPLLANVALHGLEMALTQVFPTRKSINGKPTQWKPQVIRYADDFVILHPNHEAIQTCQNIVQEWLQEMGLEMKPSKTRLMHTLNPIEGNVGFDFLGFNIRQHPVGKYHSGKTGQGEKLGFKTIITPSKQALLNHHKELATAIRTHRASPQAKLIGVLNPKIRGWTNYYCTVVSRRTFEKADALLYPVLKRWAKRRHPHKGGRWVRHKYWQEDWSFATPDGIKLLKHQDTSVIRYVKVKEDRSPFDGDWNYWTARQGNSPMLLAKIAKLLRQQQGKCPCCGLFLRHEDIREVHHIDGDHHNNHPGNRVLIHRHCHDVVHAREPVHLTGAELLRSRVR